MTTAHQSRSLAVAASVPWTLHALADHVADHGLPAPSEIQIPGGVLDVDPERRVHISLDSTDVDAWLDTLEISSTVHRDTVAGTIHDVYGLANAIRVRVQWFTCETRLAPATVLTVVDALVDHEPCKNPDCKQILCYCPADDVCPGTVIPGCSHLAEFVCEDHRGDCTECADDMAAERGRSL